MGDDEGRGVGGAGVMTAVSTSPGGLGGVGVGVVEYLQVKHVISIKKHGYKKKKHT